MKIWLRKSARPRGAGFLFSREVRRSYVRGDDYQDSHLRRKYGITIDDYALKFSEQNGKCAICKATPTKVNRANKKMLVVDHDHYTLAVRGLLCHRCNVMLGFADDNIDLLANAIEYLKLHGSGKYVRKIV